MVGGRPRHTPRPRVRHVDGHQLPSQRAGVVEEDQLVVRRAAAPAPLVTIFYQHLDRLPQIGAHLLRGDALLQVFDQVEAAALLLVGHIVDQAPGADRARPRAIAGQVQLVQP